MNRRSPFRLGPAAASALSILVMLAGTAPAEALDRGTFSLQILADGVPLDEYDARGRTYIEAIAEREYAIRLTNRTAGRVAVALSVDGLNTIDAKTTSAQKASKWILGPWQTITVKGWQTGSDSARRFFFTTEEKSYGAWLGKTRNLGIISAAVFHELQPEPVPIARPRLEKESRSYPSAGAAEDQAAPSAAGEAAPGKDARRSRQAESESDMAATGIGREIDHRVRRVSFEAESTPASLLEVRYEYREELIRLGALPPVAPYWEDPLARREQAHGFEEIDFAPDPFR